MADSTTIKIQQLETTETEDATPKRKASTMTTICYTICVSIGALLIIGGILMVIFGSLSQFGNAFNSPMTWCEENDTVVCLFTCTLGTLGHDGNCYDFLSKNSHQNCMERLGNYLIVNDSSRCLDNECEIKYACTGVNLNTVCSHWPTSDNCTQLTPADLNLTFGIPYGTGLFIAGLVLVIFFCLFCTIFACTGKQSCRGRSCVLCPCCDCCDNFHHEYTC